MLLSAWIKRFFVSRLQDCYDPDWEVDHKVELEVDIKATDDMASEINFIFKPSLNIRFK